MKFFASALLFAGLCSGPLMAQSLTVEELRAKIDQRVAAVNPYQELLADPDPARSMAAVEIMLESKDVVLERMAIEFGLLSSSPAVRRRALDAYLAAGPSLTMRLDGSKTESPSFAQLLRGSWRGSVDADGVAYTTWKVGGFDESEGCYLFEGYSQCFVKVSANGVAISGSNLSAQLQNDGSGTLSGVASLGGVTESIPITIDLVD